MTPSIKITGELTPDEIEEILMCVRGIEARNPKKQYAILIDSENMATGRAIDMLNNMFNETDWFSRLRKEAH